MVTHHQWFPQMINDHYELIEQILLYLRLMVGLVLVKSPANVTQHTVNGSG